MLGALIIVFREVLEAGLIIGIVIAASRGAPGRGAWIAAGVLAGVVGAGVVALFAGAIADAFEGSGQELLNATVLGGAVLMLMWHNAWMARHGRELAAEMKAVGAAVTAGQRPMTALAVVVGLAVLREGSEVVLFLYGIVATGTSASAPPRGRAWCRRRCALTALTYFGLLRIPARYLFGHERVDRGAGGGHGGAGGSVPRCRRRDSRAGTAALGQLRPGCHRTASSAACCTRWSGYTEPADRAAARGLSRHPSSHGGAHMDGWALPEPGERTHGRSLVPRHRCFDSLGPG